MQMQVSRSNNLKIPKKINIDVYKRQELNNLVVEQVAKAHLKGDTPSIILELEELSPYYFCLLYTSFYVTLNDIL